MLGKAQASRGGAAAARVRVLLGHIGTTLWPSRTARGPRLP